MERQCACCKSQFRPDRYHRNQSYCSKKSCQRKRRSIWQKNKLQTDVSYRENQADAQTLWQSKNPGYWKSYRASHPAYLERNRAQQKQRRESKSHVVAQPQPTAVAKMDVASGQKPLESGRYRLMSLDGENVAKMDFAIVQLSIIEQLTGTG
jgi:acetyl/propionyl-CoA carboxylase alpha subunit